MYQADVIFRPMMPTSSSAAKMRLPGCHRLFEQDDADDHGALRANSGPDRISRTERQCFRRACQQEKAHRHAGKREQRPAELCESL